jgi:hypothetical protein
MDTHGVRAARGGLMLGLMRRPASLVAVLFALACSSGPSPEHGTTEATTSGSETTPARPTGPPPAFVASSARVYARINVARIRSSPVGPDISSAIRATQSWQTYAGSSGIDPIESFDAIVIGADAVYADRRTILLRHTRTDADVRDAVLRMSVARGGTPAWSEVSGLSVAVPPQELTVPHSLVLTAQHEVVVAPSDEVPAVATVALDQAARRAEPTDPVDPNLAFGPTEIVTVRVDEQPARREGWPEPPLRYRVEVNEDPATQDVIVDFHGDFDTAEHCHASREQLAQMASFYAGQMLVRAAGLNRPLEQLQLTENGTTLDGHTRFTQDEIRRALGALALMQLQQGG